MMKKEYSTIIVLVLAFIVVYILSGQIAFLYISLSIGIVSLFAPFIASKIHFIWMKLSEIFGTISSTIILTVVYFIIVVPLALLAKLAGKRFLSLKRKNSS